MNSLKLKEIIAQCLRKISFWS